MSAPQNLKVTWKNVPTRTITAGGGEFAYRELGTDNPGTPVVFLVHLIALRLATTRFPQNSRKSSPTPISKSSQNAKNNNCSVKTPLYNPPNPCLMLKC
jgi:hypothetical protein